MNRHPFGVRCVSTALVRGAAAFFESNEMTSPKYQRKAKAAPPRTKAVLTHRTPKV